jgi:hypothetical protein
MDLNSVLEQALNTSMITGQLKPTPACPNPMALINGKQFGCPVGISSISVVNTKCTCGDGSACIDCSQDNPLIVGMNTTMKGNHAAPSMAVGTGMALMSTLMALLI